MDSIGPLLPFVVLLALAYLLFIRPARKRAQQVQTLQSALSVGDEVMLTSGIYGHLVGLDESRVSLEVSPGTVLTVHRAAVEKVVRDEISPDGGATAADDVDGSGAREDDGPNGTGRGTV